MTVLYLDTEFNGWGGELISIALVGDGHEFYGACKTSQRLVQWVAENVEPKIGIPQIGYANMREALHGFLSSLPDGIEVVADWPCDFTYLTQLLVSAPGECLTKQLTMRLVYDTNYEPENPHNALSDAYALKRAVEGR